MPPKHKSHGLYVIPNEGRRYGGRAAVSHSGPATIDCGRARARTPPRGPRPIPPAPCLAPPTLPTAAPTPQAALRAAAPLATAPPALPPAVLDALHGGTARAAQALADVGHRLQVGAWAKLGALALLLPIAL